MTNEHHGTGKRWVLAWLVFGLLTAYEVGALAMRANNDWGAVLSLAFLVGSVASLSVLALRAIHHAHPAKLHTPIAISLLVLLACLWALYGSGAPAGCTPTLVFAAVNSGACLFASGAALAAAWRRSRLHEAHMAEVHAQRERQRRLEGVRAESAALASAAANAGDGGPLGPDSDFVLPARPKWEES